jgi:hypothetical protein
MTNAIPPCSSVAGRYTAVAALPKELARAVDERESVSMRGAVTAKEPSE